MVWTSLIVASILVILYTKIKNNNALLLINSCLCSLIAFSIPAAYCYFFDLSMFVCLPHLLFGFAWHYFRYRNPRENFEQKFEYLKDILGYNQPQNRWNDYFDVEKNMPGYDNTRDSHSKKDDLYVNLSWLAELKVLAYSFISASIAYYVTDFSASLAGTPTFVLPVVTAIVIFCMVYCEVSEQIKLSIVNNELMRIYSASQQQSANHRQTNSNQQSSYTSSQSTNHSQSSRSHHSEHKEERTQSSSQSYNASNQGKSDLQKYFEILELDTTATFDEVKHKRIVLLQIYHPDKHGTNEDARKFAEQKTKDINMAFDYLKTNYYRI